MLQHSWWTLTLFTLPNSERIDLTKLEAKKWLVLTFWATLYISTTEIRGTNLCVCPSNISLPGQRPLWCPAKWCHLVNAVNNVLPAYAFAVFHAPVPLGSIFYCFVCNDQFRRVNRLFRLFAFQLLVLPVIYTTLRKNKCMYTLNNWKRYKATTETFAFAVCMPACHLYLLACCEQVLFLAASVCASVSTKHEKLLM